MQISLHQFLVHKVAPAAGSFEEDLVTHQFKRLFNEIDASSREQLLYNYVLRFCVQQADRLENEFADALAQVTSLFERAPLDASLAAFYTLFGLFLKEAYLGDSFLHWSAEKRLKREEELRRQVVPRKALRRFDFSGVVAEFALPPAERLECFGYEYVKLEHFVNLRSKEMLEHLEVDGESWLRMTPLTNLFIVLQRAIETLTRLHAADQFLQLWLGRVYYVHSQVLQEPTGTLYAKVLAAYEGFFRHLDDPASRGLYERTFLSNCRIEYSNCLLFFYKYQRSEAQLAEAQSLLRVRFNFTGKLGVNTKYQTFKVAMLVVEVERSPEEAQQIAEENSDKPNPFRLVQEHAPKNHQLDEDCILYEKPKFDEDEGAQEKTKDSALLLEEQILVLGLIRHLDKTTPHEDIFHNQVQAYCNLLIDKSLDWLVFSNALYRRSINESVRFKKMERSLLQLQQLLDQFNEPEPAACARGLYLFSLYHPSYLLLQKEVAEKYMQMGMVLSSCELFRKLEMYDDCVECLAAGGQIARAKEMAQELLGSDLCVTPKLLCAIGDLYDDISYYKKAWKQSGKHFARAQRSLGKHYFFKGEFARSIRAFQKAVAINSFHANSWFMMGCAHLKLNDGTGA